MKTKECFKCHEIKPLSGFYKHKQMKDGHLNKCKECNKKDVQKNYRKNVDYYKEYDKKRNEDRWDYKTIQCRKWRKKNPEKYKAQNAVNNALRDGKLIKQVCEVCGSKDAHAHHENYSKPLDVRWLCPQHHNDRHK